MPTSIMTAGNKGFALAADVLGTKTFDGLTFTVLHHRKDEWVATGLFGFCEHTLGMRPLKFSAAPAGSNGASFRKKIVTDSHIVFVLLTPDFTSSEGDEAYYLRVAVDKASEKPETAYYIIPCFLVPNEMPHALKSSRDHFYEPLCFWEREAWVKLRDALIAEHKRRFNP